MPDLSKISSLEDATDRELLLIILSTQLQLARRLEFLESKISDIEIKGPESMCEDIVKKLDPFINQLENALKRE